MALMYPVLPADKDKMALRASDKKGIAGWAGPLTAGSAVVIALSPLALVLLASHGSGSSPRPALVATGLLWIAAFAVYRTLVFRLDKQRRRTLRAELVAARRARVEAGDIFQDRLAEQNAVLDRIRQISEAMLEEGIVDPQTALANIRVISSHAFDGQFIIEEAIAEVRVETGSALLSFEQLDLRNEIEAIATPFIRSGYHITTDGPRHFADTDAAVFRLAIRGVVNSAIQGGASSVEIALARDNARVVCTVSDDGEDRSRDGQHELSRTAGTLIRAVGGEVTYSRALGRNNFGLSIPWCAPPAEATDALEPIDVLGSRPPARHEEPVVAPEPAPLRIKPDDPIKFSDSLPSPGDLAEATG